MIVAAERCQRDFASGGSLERLRDDLDILCARSVELLQDALDPGSLSGAVWTANQEMREVTRVDELRNLLRLQLVIGELRELSRSILVHPESHCARRMLMLHVLFASFQSILSWSQTTCALFTLSAAASLFSRRVEQSG